ncbi:hypothetical protein ACQPZX_24095 [Actinoplanes sp. CA-142083]|uniref:hypothetical protein n=1 Tax=Actinoplanes sp. CA-142083 TaxID=3239903 RepID=UPI003D8FA596
MAGIGWIHAPGPGDDDARKWSFCFPDVAWRSHHLHIFEAGSDSWPGLLAAIPRVGEPQAVRIQLGACASFRVGLVDQAESHPVVDGEPRKVLGWFAERVLG